MPATITGIVFQQLSKTGRDHSESGIGHISIVLVDPDGNCLTTQTDKSGYYSFSNLSVAGEYTIYEKTTEPAAFSASSKTISSKTRGSKKLHITKTDIENNVVFSNQNVSPFNMHTWPCSPNGLQVAGTPSDAFEINLVTGASTNLGTIQPAANYNAIGYSVVDNTIWGSRLDLSGQVIRLNSDLTTTSFAIPNLPGSFLVGDVDLNGHLYLYNPNNPPTFYVVDVNPASPTYLQLVDPTMGFSLDTAPFGTDLTGIPDDTFFDWAFNPIDNQLYGVQSDGDVIRIDPLTGAATTLTTSGLPTGNFFGAVFFDSDGALYAIHNPTGDVYRITFNGNNAQGILFSNSAASSNNDGARCPLAQINLIEITKTGPAVACPGSTITYTSVIENQSSVLAAEDVVFTDDIPAGTTFVPGSVTVGGNPTAGNPSNGIPVGDIPPNQSVTVTFQVEVDTYPAPTFPLTNQSRADGDNTAATTSNEVVTNQATANLTVQKEANPTLIEKGDVITYTLTVTNNGPDDVANIILFDTEPSGTNFIPNSVTTDGALRPGENPNAGIDIGELEVNESRVVKFRVMAVEDDCYIRNEANITYCLDQASESNSVITLVCGKRIFRDK